MSRRATGRARAAAAFGTWLLLAAAAPAAAQSVTGRVLDEASGAPIAGASIALIGDDATELARAVSDSAGAFQLHAPHAGRFLLQASHFAYTALTTDRFALAAREIVALELRLGARAIALEPLVITARSRQERTRLDAFHRRSQDAARRGRFLTADDIAADPAGSVAQLLDRQPDVRIERVRFENRIVLRGTMARCTPDIVIDGLRLGAGVDPDSFIAPDDLYGVEIYTDPLNVPPELRASGTCGVVAFWSKPESRRPWSWWRMGVGAAVLGVILFIF